jgi:hypothetical protein
LVGGRDSDRDLVNEIWSLSVDQGTWERIVPSKPIGQVIDATYSFRDRQLWVIDVNPDRAKHDESRLLRIDPAFGTVDTIASSGPKQQNVLYDTRGLLVDLDGSVLVYASSTQSQKHRIARIDSRPSGAVEIAITLRRQRALSAPPIADLLGFTLYFEPDRPAEDPAQGPEDDPVVSDKTVAGTRLDALPLRNGRVEHLANLLR